MSTTTRLDDDVHEWLWNHITFNEKSISAVMRKQIEDNKEKDKIIKLLKEKVSD